MAYINAAIVLIVLFLTYISAALINFELTITTSNDKNFIAQYQTLIVAIGALFGVYMAYQGVLRQIQETNKRTWLYDTKDNITNFLSHIDTLTYSLENLKRSINDKSQNGHWRTKRDEIKKELNNREADAQESLLHLKVLINSDEHESLTEHITQIIQSLDTLRKELLTKNSSDPKTIDKLISNINTNKDKIENDFKTLFQSSQSLKWYNTV